MGNYFRSAAVYFILCLSLWDIYFQVCCPSLDEAGKFEHFGLRRMGFLGLETVPTQISCRVFSLTGFSGSCSESCFSAINVRTTLFCQILIRNLSVVFNLLNSSRYTAKTAKKRSFFHVVLLGGTEIWSVV